MGVYITTSKNPSEKTKQLCRALSSILPHSVYESRGRKSIEQVFRRARVLGKSRAVLVYETHGVPSRMCFMRIKAHSWKWIEDEIALSNFKIYKLPNYLPDELAVSGRRKNELEALFDFPQPKGEEFIKLKSNSKKIIFSYKKPLLELIL
ncbi:MAG: hypothetical protein QXF56_03920 [Candidatus Micrarchaeia archaeon]